MPHQDSLPLALLFVAGQLRTTISGFLQNNFLPLAPSEPRPQRNMSTSMAGHDCLCCRFKDGGAAKHLTSRVSETVSWGLSRRQNP